MVRYNSKEFTETSFSELLEYAKKYYKFLLYSDLNLHKIENYIILRHDIDFSPHRALALARIEHKYGIKSTFFVRVSCEYYSVFDRHTKEIISNIISLGHCIGLHFDSTFYKIENIDLLEKYIKFEVSILNELFDTDIEYFTFHIPDIQNLGVDVKNIEQIGKIKNAFSNRFLNGIKYVSDSSGYWRYDNAIKIIKSRKYKKIHFLIHPVWWTKEELLPYEKIKRAIYGRSKNLENFYLNNQIKFKRKIIGKL